MYYLPNERGIGPRFKYTTRRCVWITLLAILDVVARPIVTEIVMGYTTSFRGQFDLSQTLTEAHRNYLKAFNDKRRMRRDAQIADGMPDVVRRAVNLPIGPEGAYFTGGTGFAGQDKDKSVTDHNASPEGQPGLWCQWTPNQDGTAIVWDEGEKFYDYVEWLNYLIRHFLSPWGYTLNGRVTFQGEDDTDYGEIVVKDNVVTKRYIDNSWPDQVEP